MSEAVLKNVWKAFIYRCDGGRALKDVHSRATVVLMLAGLKDVSVFAQINSFFIQEAPGVTFTQA